MPVYLGGKKCSPYVWDKMERPQISSLQWIPHPFHPSLCKSVKHIDSSFAFRSPKICYDKMFPAMINNFYQNKCL